MDGWDDWWTPHPAIRHDEGVPIQPSPVTLNHYLQHRRVYEALFWFLALTLNWAANTWVVWQDMQRAGQAHALWEPVVWESTSTLMIAALIPLIIWFNGHYPLRLGRLKKSIPAHIAMSFAFSVLHVIGMVLLRRLIYATQGASYDFGIWTEQLAYEYAKDFRSYLLILSIIYLYNFILRRLQGEAGFLEEGQEETAPQPVTDRFLVKKLGREFLVKVEDIDWIEAAGNYVNLHVGKRLYPLRDTMTAMEARLEGSGFLRVHRSAIVNMDQVTEIVPLEAGEAEIHLASGDTVPVSRSYRQQLKARLA